MKSQPIPRKLTALAMTLPLIWSATAYGAEKVAPGQLGCDAPKLDGLEWVKGDPVEIEKGSVYVVEFWATWCGPCIKGIPHVTELQEKFRDRGVNIIGVTRETADKVRPFVEKQGKRMGYTVAMDPEGKVHEGYMEAFSQGGIPHAFIVDQGGRIAWHGHPMTMDEPLEQIVSGTYDLEEIARRMAEEQARKDRARAEFQKKYEALEQRVAELSAEIEKQPENVELLIQRAETRLGDSFTTEMSYRPGDLIKALEDYRKAKSLDPEDRHGAAEQVAFFEAWQDRSDERTEMLRSFTETYPDSRRVPFAMYSLYHAANQQDRKEQALKYLTVAADAELDSRFGEALASMKTMLEKELEAAEAGTATE